PVDRDVPRSTHSRHDRRSRRVPHGFVPDLTLPSKSCARGKRRAAWRIARRLSPPPLALARRYQSSQSPESIEMAFRKLALAPGSKPAPSCARPRASHGAGDQGIQVLARRASVAARAQLWFCRAASLRLRAVLPTRPTAAKPAATTTTTTAVHRVGPESGGERSERRAARRMAAAERSPVRVTAVSSQSQSTPVCTEYAKEGSG